MEGMTSFICPSTAHWTPESGCDTTTTSPLEADLEAQRREDDAQRSFQADVYETATESLLAVARRKANIDRLWDALRGAYLIGAQPPADGPGDLFVSAAHEYLLALARDPENLSLVCRRILTGVDALLSYQQRTLEEFRRRPMPCGHVARFWEPREGENVERFVVDPEAFGECLICKAVQQCGNG